MPRSPVASSNSPFFDFPPADFARWEAALAKASTTAEALRSEVEGLPVEPLYTSQNSATPLARPSSPASWTRALAYARADAHGLADVLEADAAAGVQSAWIRLESALTTRGRHRDDPRGGTVLRNVGDVRALLEVARRHSLLLRLDAGAGGPLVAGLVTAALEEMKWAPAQASVSVACDPLGTIAVYGSLGCTFEDALADVADVAGWARETGIVQPTLDCCAAVMHDAGATAADELAIGLCMALTYARALDARGIEPAEAFARMTLTLGAGSDLFLHAAKLRAARILWSSVARRCGVEGEAARPRILVNTSWRVMTANDPWVNLLRGTVGTFSAIVGGADEIATRPYSEAAGTPDRSARRWAVNTQHILDAESHLGWVADAGAGSWYLESLTSSLAEGAWARVRELEASGGLIEGLTKRTVQRFVAQSRRSRWQAQATGRRVLTGVSLYPLLDERRPLLDENVVPTATEEMPEQPVTLVAPDAHGARTRSVARVVAQGGSVARLKLPSKTGGASIEAMITERIAVPIETLRDASDQYLARHGRRPTVLAVVLGPPAEHKKRLDFARGMMAVGGFETEVAQGDDAVEALRRSGAKIAVLCGDDERLVEAAQTLCPALRAAGAVRVIVSGRPGDTETALRQAGVDAFAHYSADAPALLKALHAATEVNR